MKCSLGISNFLEELSSLSHSVVFLYFFALITEEGQVVWYSQLFQNFPQFIVIHTVKGLEMARVNFDILGISELKWTGMGEFNSEDHYIYYCGQESLRRNGAALIANKRI